MERQQNIEYILDLSYGKDSLGCLEVIKRLGLPLDRIVHAEVWATDTILADPPPMVEFKAHADKVIKELFGIDVEHVCAMRDGQKVTYEREFYRQYEKSRTPEKNGKIWGFPFTRTGAWCNSSLKRAALKNIGSSNDVHYLGIAADEPARFHVLSETKRSPLVEAGWTEEMCRQWCQDNGLLSPIYTTFKRGWCWFCHNQGIDSLRALRRDYPEYWEMLLKWDKDSPVSFKPGGLSVHDFDLRFQLEQEGLLPIGPSFRWSMIKDNAK